MSSEAQKRANRKYKRRLREEKKLKYVQMEFNESEADLYEYVQSHKPTRTFIKQIIREHMENN